MEELKNFPGVLTGFLEKKAEVYTQGCRYLDLPTISEGKEHSKTTTLQYMVVQEMFAYNVILSRPTLNVVEAAASYPHLCIKYPLPG